MLFLLFEKCIHDTQLHSIHYNDYVICISSPTPVRVSLDKLRPKDTCSSDQMIRNGSFRSESLRVGSTPLSLALLAAFLLTTPLLPFQQDLIVILVYIASDFTSVESIHTRIVPSSDINLNASKSKSEFSIILLTKLHGHVTLRPSGIKWPCVLLCN